jgi:hypothetical protein
LESGPGTYWSSGEAFLAASWADATQESRIIRAAIVRRVDMRFSAKTKVSSDYVRRSGPFTGRFVAPPNADRM